MTHPVTLTLALAATLSTAAAGAQALRTSRPPPHRPTSLVFTFRPQKV